MSRNELRGVLLALASSLACSSGPGLPRTAGPVVLEVGGSVKGGPYRLGEAALAALPQGDALGVEPGTDRAVRFEGLSLAALGERVELERGADTLVVRSADGEAVPIPLSVVRQLRPILAARAGGAALDSRMLAWPSVRHHGFTSDPRAASWWVRRVVKVDYVSWRLVCGKAVRVPEGAPRGALAGARTFAARCIGCHSVRGIGGSTGPGLEKGGPFTEPERLRALLAAHPRRSGSRLGPERVLELAVFLGTIARSAPEDVEDEASR